MAVTEKAAAISISKRKIRSLVHNSAGSARAIDLLYVNDKQKGIQRIKKGKGFAYLADGKPVTDNAILARIKSLVLPPAWTNVWIAMPDNAHLQATGLDSNGRKQYRYHALWNAIRSETKFVHLHDLGMALPLIRKQVTAHLALPGLPQHKVLAAIVSLMEHTGIRIGNSSYEKLYGSFGVTTLKDDHVHIKGSEVQFSFKGKKGVFQDITIKSRKLAKIVEQCRDVPGKELFQYYDEHGERRSVDSGMVNSYIKEICGGDFTAKDLRTWTGTLCALEAFRSLGCCDTVSDTRKKIIEALDITAKRLGNTRTVCKKYYVHPVVIDHYTNKTIEKFEKLVASADPENTLTTEEQILMKMLERAGASTIG